eukprot:m.27116 g.27116  ORF g.27116 m.27116 type:complete len:87 (-) comp8895_c0_seq2:629-889(-)
MTRVFKQPTQAISFAMLIVLSRECLSTAFQCSCGVSVCVQPPDICRTSIVSYMLGGMSYLYQRNALPPDYLLNHLLNIHSTLFELR